jgi:hypothetical protein
MIRGEHHGIIQNELDYLGRDLKLPKSKADLLVSRFDSGIFPMTIRRHLPSVSAKEVWLRMFRMRLNIFLCDDVDGLLKPLNIHHIPEE